MKQDSSNADLLVKYLLGELSQEEESQVEEQYFADDELHEELQAVELDLIDRYVNNELSGYQQENFEKRFLSVPGRLQEVEFAMALKSYISRRQGPGWANRLGVVRSFKSWARPLSIPLQAAAMVLVVLAAGFLTWQVFFYQSEVNKGIAALRDAYRERRPVEARVSGLNYAPFAVVRGNNKQDADYISLNRAERILLDEVVEDPSSAAHHAAGRLYLTGKEFDRAIDQFEEALRIDSSNAQVHSDLGAALFEKAKADRINDEPGKALEGFAKSLGHLNKALELDGSLLEALFNRALLYQNMNLPQQAYEDWQKYLENDPSSKWADEARRNLKDIEERRKANSLKQSEPLRRFVEAYQTRNDEAAYELMSKNTEAIKGQLIWQQLIGAYLDLASKGERDKAAPYLRPLIYAGELQERRTGDLFISHLARFYASPSLKRETVLARAYALIDQANLLLARSETDGALALYKEAKGLFDRTGNQLESRFADYWIGYCHYRKTDFEEGLSVLSPLAEYCKARSYLWLLGQAETFIGVIRGDLNQFSIAIESQTRALEVSKRIDDIYNVQKNLTILAYEYKNLGNNQKSLTYMQRCLESTGAYWPGARQMYRNYDTAAGILNLFGYYAAAAEYQKAALQIALEDAKDPGFEHLSYVHLGAIYTKLRDYVQALRYAELSYQTAKSMSDQRTRLRPMAHSALQLGQIYRHVGDYNEAATRYAEAIRLYEGLSLFAFLYEAHKGKLLCSIAQGNDALAKEELKTVLALFEEHRAKIMEEENRNSFFDVEQNVYDIAIDFEYSRMRDHQKAFEYSEVSRARSLLDLMNAGAEVVGKDNPHVVFSSVSQPLMPSGIREKLPEQVQILQYAVLEDKLLIWVISKAKFEVAEVSIGSGSLTDKVLNYLRSVSSLTADEAQKVRGEASELYKILIGPVESFLDGNKQICIVPDKILYCLPFSALISPRTGKHLINDYVLSFAPSSNIFRLCTESARERSGKRDEKVLSVGDPRFDRGAFPDLLELHSSGKEAEEVAHCYSSASCLTAKNAMKDRVKGEMERADVIHLASHYVVDEQNSMFSKLLLTPGTKGGSPSEGVLQGHEIYKIKLPVTRLVVLSACRTGIERYYKGEGMIGMSRTFLAAGVPLVAASLWPVDSDSTAHLMASFHRYRSRRDISTAQALRQAQLDMIGNPERLYDNPYHWAAFVLIGGYASF